MGTQLDRVEWNQLDRLSWVKSKTERIDIFYRNLNDSQLIIDNIYLDTCTGRYSFDQLEFVPMIIGNVIDMDLGSP